MTLTSILATIGSVVGGGVIAAVGVVGLVSTQTAGPDQTPTSVEQPVVVDYGSN